MKKNRKKPVRKLLRNILLILAMISFSAACLSAITVKLEVTTNQTIPLYSHTMTAGANYKVNLTPNTLFTETSLEEGGTYARQLIKNITFDFWGNFSGSSPAKIMCEYEIYAVLRGYQGSPGEGKVYETRYPLVNLKNITSDEKKLSFTDSAAVLLSQYIQDADSAESIVGTKMSRELNIVIEGIFTSETEYGEVNEPFSYAVNVPINLDLMTITKPENILKDGAINDTVEVTEKASRSPLILICIWALTSLAAFALVFLLTRVPDSHEEYKMDFRSILRKYGSRIIKLDDIPHKTTFLKSIIVSDIDDLIKAANELARPVCYCPNHDGMPKDGLMFVLSDDGCYIYYMGHGDASPIEFNNKYGKNATSFCL